MYSHRYQQILSKIAIFLVIFASFAPSISHGMAARNNNSSFLQEICSSNGTKKIVIQTITTQGQQLSAVFQAKIPQSNTPASTVLQLRCRRKGSALGVKRCLQGCYFGEFWLEIRLKVADLA